MLCRVSRHKSDGQHWLHLFFLGSHRDRAGRRRVHVDHYRGGGLHHPAGVWEPAATEEPGLWCRVLQGVRWTHSHWFQSAGDVSLFLSHPVRWDFIIQIVLKMSLQFCNESLLSHSLTLGMPFECPCKLLFNCLQGLLSLPSWIPTLCVLSSSSEFSKWASFVSFSPPQRQLLKRNCSNDQDMSIVREGTRMHPGM